MTPEQIQDKANHVFMDNGRNVFMYDGRNRISYNEDEIVDMQRDAFVDGAEWMQGETDKQLTAKDAEIAELKAERRGVWYKLWKESEAENATLRGELEEAKKWLKRAGKLQGHIQSELDMAKERVREAARAAATATATATAPATATATDMNQFPSP